MIPSPGDLLRRYGLRARKSWGQHFLHAPNVHEAIVNAAKGSARVVEIGAGLGTLTAHLLAAGIEVWAIERDRDLCEVLRSELGERPGFRLIEADAVSFDYASAAPATIVGNLPYQLTGPLLFALLRFHEETGPWIVMVQKEVADRLCAPPGNKTYGGITVALSRVRALSRVVPVPPGAFLPPPRVESAVIRLEPLATPRGEVADEAAFLDLVRRAFQQRRKTIANALTSIAPREAVLRWCHAAEIDPSLRPERIAVEGFAALQRAREAEGA